MTNYYYYYYSIELLKDKRVAYHLSVKFLKDWILVICSVYIEDKYQIFTEVVCPPWSLDALYCV